MMSVMSTTSSDAAGCRKLTIVSVSEAPVHVHSAAVITVYIRMYDATNVCWSLNYVCKILNDNMVNDARTDLFG
jgi:hypothetical protein